MSRNDPTEVLVAVHFDSPSRNARLVSINGENARAIWIAKSITQSFHLIGQTTFGTDKAGARVTLPLANMTMPHWLAKDRGFI